MARRRVLVISHEYSLSGAPIALFHLLTRLSGRVDFLVASPSDGPLGAAFLERGINALVVPNILNDESISSKLLDSYDALLANTLLSYTPIHAAAKAEKPALWFIHEGQVGHKFLEATPKMAAALPLASQVVVPCRFSRDLYAPWLGQRQAVVIPYGVEALVPAAPPSAGHPVQMLQLGSFEPRKGQDVALAAFRRLNDTGFNLNIVGLVRNAAYQQRVRSDFADVRNVQYGAEVGQHQAQAMVAGCDILIVPSRDEVTPMVILEAMALGKPVIASRICGIPEMIVDGETGFLFEKEDVSQLARLMHHVGRDPELRQRVGRQAREFVRRERTMEQYAGGFTDVFTQWGIA
jgi:glycosyltransferase involved in cell wall biosynthesis